MKEKKFKETALAYLRTKKYLFVIDCKTEESRSSKIILRQDSCNSSKCKAKTDAVVLEKGIVKKKTQPVLRLKMLKFGPTTYINQGKIREIYRLVISTLFYMTHFAYN